MAGGTRPVSLSDLPWPTRIWLVATVGARGLAKSLALSLVALAPGVILSVFDPFLGTLALFTGSFWLVARNYSKPWRLMWPTCLLPPLSAGLSYLFQLLIVGQQMPNPMILAGAVAVGAIFGWLRARTHDVYIEDNQIFAGRSVVYLAVWAAAFALTQVLAFVQAQEWLEIGFIAGAFSTSMLITVSIVLLMSLVEKKRQLKLASQSVLPFVLLIGFSSMAALSIEPVLAQDKLSPQQVVDILIRDLQYPGPVVSKYIVDRSPQPGFSLVETARMGVRVQISKTVSRVRTVTPGNSRQRRPPELQRYSESMPHYVRIEVDVTRWESRAAMREWSGIDRIRRQGRERFRFDRQYQFNSNSYERLGFGEYSAVNNLITTRMPWYGDSNAARERNRIYRAVAASGEWAVSVQVNPHFSNMWVEGSYGWDMAMEPSALEAGQSKALAIRLTRQAFERMQSLGLGYEGGFTIDLERLSIESLMGLFNDFWNRLNSRSGPELTEIPFAALLAAFIAFLASLGIVIANTVVAELLPELEVLGERLAKDKEVLPPIQDPRTGKALRQNKKGQYKVDGVWMDRSEAMATMADREAQMAIEAREAKQREAENRAKHKRWSAEDRKRRARHRAEEEAALKAREKKLETQAKLEAKEKDEIFKRLQKAISGLSDDKRQQAYREEFATYIESGDKEGAKALLRDILGQEAGLGWQDVARRNQRALDEASAKDSAAELAERLAKLDPARKQEYEDNIFINNLHKKIVEIEDPEKRRAYEEELDEYARVGDMEGAKALLRDILGLEAGLGWQDVARRNQQALDKARAEDITEALAKVDPARRQEYEDNIFINNLHKKIVEIEDPEKRRAYEKELDEYTQTGDMEAAKELFRAVTMKRIRNAEQRSVVDQRWATAHAVGEFGSKIALNAAKAGLAVVGGQIVIAHGAATGLAGAALSTGMIGGTEDAARAFSEGRLDDVASAFAVGAGAGAKDGLVNTMTGLGWGSNIARIGGSAFFEAGEIYVRTGDGQQAIMAAGVSVLADLGRFRTSTFKNPQLRTLAEAATNMGEATGKSVLMGRSLEEAMMDGLAGHMGGKAGGHVGMRGARGTSDYGPTEASLRNLLDQTSAAKKKPIPLEEQGQVMQDLLKSRYQDPATGEDYVDTVQALSQLRNTRSSRSGKQMDVEDQAPVIRTRRERIYAEPDRRTIESAHENLRAARRRGETDLLQPGDRLEMDTFSTPGQPQKRMGADRDARMVIVREVAGTKQRIEVPRKYWETEAYSHFREYTQKLIEKSGGKIDQTTHADYHERMQHWQHYKKQPMSDSEITAFKAQGKTDAEIAQIEARRPGLTESEIADRAWADVHNQVFTDRHHIDASKDNSDQGSRIAYRPGEAGTRKRGLEPSQVRSPVLDAKESSSLRGLTDPEGFSRMWEAKSEIYHEMRNTPEAVAQSQKGIEQYFDLRKAAQARGQKPPSIPGDVRQAMRIILEAPVGNDATPARMARLEQTLGQHNIGSVADATRIIAYQHELLKWSGR